jgi:hypothetical protein
VIIEYAMDNESQKTTVSYAVIAIVAAVAMFGVAVLTVTVTIPLQQQQAEAARPVGAGCPASVPGANASKTRCFHG